MWNSCRYHKECTLQNFCQYQQCSMPLCPKCIQYHLQEPLPHNIVPFDSIIADTAEYLEICVKGFTTELNQLESELKPETIHNHYGEIVEKYRLEAIDQINQYYKTLSQELLLEIQNVCALHLSSHKAQLQDKLQQFNKYLKQIKQQSTVIPTLIVTNLNNQSYQAQVLFKAYREKRQIFRNFLPILEPGINGKLEVFSRASAPQPVPKIHKTDTVQQVHSKSHRGKKELGNTDRIASLEEKLYLLRSRAT